MKYKRKEIDEVFAIDFMEKGESERDEIMENMNEKQLSELSLNIVRVVTGNLKEKPLIIKEH